MSQRLNHLQQPIGDAVPDWAPAEFPRIDQLTGAYCDVVAMDAENHAGDLFAAFGEDRIGRMWTYMFVGPFESKQSLAGWLQSTSFSPDHFRCAIVEKQTGKAQGFASYMRVQQDNGVVEVGGIALAPRLQRTRASTEAMYLMMRQVFEEFGYRRYEWKCDALNAPSRQAALRLGFSFEGIFRQAAIYRDRNRDTAWYSVLDSEWPALKLAFEAWLAPTNFDAHGQQRHRLIDLITEHRQQ